MAISRVPLKCPDCKEYYSSTRLIGDKIPSFFRGYFSDIMVYDVKGHKCKKNE